MGIALYLFSRLFRMKSFARPMFVGIERGRRVLSSYCFQTIGEVRFCSVPRLPYSQCSRSSGSGCFRGGRGRGHTKPKQDFGEFRIEKRTDRFRVGRGMRFHFGTYSRLIPRGSSGFGGFALGATARRHLERVLIVPPFWNVPPPILEGMSGAALRSGLPH